MAIENLPDQVILHRSDDDSYILVKQLLSQWEIDVHEATVLAEITNRDVLDNMPLAIAIISDLNSSGIEFLRSIMQTDNLIQRMMLSPSSDIDLYELAINKVHINYLVKLPLNEAEFAACLRKANRRYQNLIRPFTKFDALTKITEDLLVDIEKYRMEATTDALTKLMNRRSFNNLLKRIWQRFKEKKIDFSLALLDIDYFKRINDTYGHSAGDEVLRKFAEIILSNQRIGMDYAFRYGGEEFAIISININHQEMMSYLNRILYLVRDKIFRFENNEISITFSAGISQAKFSESPEMLINKADEALYNAKETGRNQVLAHMSEKK